MLFLRVPKSQGEKIRQELIANGILDPDYSVFSEAGFVFFPVTKKYRDFTVVEREGEHRERRYTSLKQALAGILSDEEQESLITSFDIIGGIAILEIPEQLQAKEKEIANAVMQVHPHLKSVFSKLSAMEGKFRVRRLRHLAGEKKTETIYREHGYRFMLDVSKVYFSVRLSHERKRISELVKENEDVLVMFAGVGPFAVVIAKNHPDARVTAIELNPDAVKYMKENVQLNRCSNIEVIEADAGKHDYRKQFDRIIMPLPKSAHEFMDVAKRIAKPGAMIHYYSIAGSDDPAANAMKKIDSSGLTLISSRIVKPYSADMVQIVLDLSVQ